MMGHGVVEYLGTWKSTYKRAAPIFEDSTALTGQALTWNFHGSLKSLTQ